VGSPKTGEEEEDDDDDDDDREVNKYSISTAYRSVSALPTARRAAVHFFCY